MTLIVAALNTRGIVIAADRRNVGFSRKTGEKFVSADTQNKILIESKRLFALYGKSFSYPYTADTELCKLTSDILPDATPDEVLHQIGSTLDGEIPKSVILCAQYRDNHPKLSGWRDGKNMHIAAQQDGTTETAVYFFGKEAETARQLFRNHKPYLPLFDAQNIINYTTFLIKITHLLNRFSFYTINNVRYDVTVGVTDHKGTQIIYGSDYQPARF